MPTWAPSFSALEVREARRLRGLGALQRDDGLAHVVVAGREVHGLLALGADRHLVDVEVEGLRTGREGLVEGHALPHDSPRRSRVARATAYATADSKPLLLAGLSSLNHGSYAGSSVATVSLPDVRVLNAPLAQASAVAPGSLAGRLLLRLRGAAHGEGEQGDGAGGRGTAQGALGSMHGGRVAANPAVCPGHSGNCPHGGNVCCSPVNTSATAAPRTDPAVGGPGPPAEGGDRRAGGPAAQEPSSCAGPPPVDCAGAGSGERARDTGACARFTRGAHVRRRAPRAISAPAFTSPGAPLRRGAGARRRGWCRCRGRGRPRSRRAAGRRSWSRRRGSGWRSRRVARRVAHPAGEEAVAGEHVGCPCGSS